MTEALFEKNVFNVYFDFLFWSMPHLLRWTAARKNDYAFDKTKPGLKSMAQYFPVNLRAQYTENSKRLHGLNEWQHVLNNQLFGDNVGTLIVLFTACFLCPPKVAQKSVNPHLTRENGDTWTDSGGIIGNSIDADFSLGKSSERFFDFFIFVNLFDENNF